MLTAELRSHSNIKTLKGASVIKFKIVMLEWETLPSNKCTEVKVGFETDRDNFGYLGEYFRGVVVPDIDAFNKNYEMQIEDIKEARAKGDGSLKYYNENSPYSKGLCSMQNISGADRITSFPERLNYFEYNQFVVVCPITEACISQLKTMKEEIDAGKCKFGDYPAQNGCFRSGDAFSDFIGILECLDRFWS